jgi:glycosyltransferase involved in cell wall biosynthesis
VARVNRAQQDMKILAVAPHVPYEGIPHAGGSYLLRHLQELTRLGSRVALIAPGTPEQLLNVSLAPEWLDLIMGPNTVADRTEMRWLLDAAYRRAMNSPPAPSAESLRSILRSGFVKRARAADLVELHWAEYARFASVLRRANVETPICVVEHDVDLEAAVRRVHATGYRRILGLLTAPIARRHERRGLMDADLIAVFTGADEQVVRRAGIQTSVQLIDPWLEEPTGPKPSRQPGSVLFTGALWRRENEDGLIWFLEEVWPQVRATLQQAKLNLVGASPSERLKAAAHGTSGVDVIGDVPSLLPYYRSASAFVAPLFVPGGLKFKVPQAMLCGLPVIATTIAVEGVADFAPAGVLWTVTNDPQEMAAGVVEALKNEVEALEVGRNAARWVGEHYSFPRSVLRLLEVYERLVEESNSSSQHAA